MTRFQDFLKKELLYAGMSAEDYNLIRRDIHEENRKSMLTFSAITVVFLLIMLILCSVLYYVKRTKKTEK